MRKAASWSELPGAGKPALTGKVMPWTVMLLLVAELEMFSARPTPAPSMVVSVFVTPGSANNVRLLALELL
ncbi:MAG: hypothetical protein ACLQM8_13355 [Limisphaerales bacterium]